ncbi:MAG TPA: DinB family protein [Thermoanaerobaculia bacterium]|jgi:uncharacterized damage-inducible protein DinB
MAKSSVPTAAPLPARSIRDQFLEVYEAEHQITMRVLRAYPPEKATLRPAPKSKTALDLAWMFVLEQDGIEQALTTGFDWGKTMPVRKPPQTFDEILASFQKGHERIRGLISVQRDEELAETIQFPVGPGRLGDWTKINFLWRILHDQIHHRGQFSVYLRIADAKLPSIYGPTADEPWF